MISAYHFSLTGRDHTARNMPCHDYSLIREVSASWKIAIVADGVGSCAHADIAAKTAAEAAADLIEKQFPPSSAEDADYISVIIAAMHGAANAIEAYVSKNDDGIQADKLLAGIIPLFELDSYATPVVMMSAVPGDVLDPTVEQAYRSALGYEGKIEQMERYAFYERAKKAYAIVLTGETAKYGNVILKKGVTPVASLDV